MGKIGRRSSFVFTKKKRFVQNDKLGVVRRKFRESRGKLENEFLSHLLRASLSSKNTKFEKKPPPHDVLEEKKVGFFLFGSSRRQRRAIVKPTNNKNKQHVDSVNNIRTLTSIVTLFSRLYTNEVYLLSSLSSRLLLDFFSHRKFSLCNIQHTSLSSGKSNKNTRIMKKKTKFVQYFRCRCWKLFLERIIISKHETNVK